MTSTPALAEHLTSLVRLSGTLLADGGEDGGGGGDGGGDGGGAVDLVSLLTPEVLLVLAVVTLLLVVALALAGTVAYRRARRSGLLTQGLAALRSQTLPPGAARELQQLRVRLRQSATTTERAVVDAAATGRDVHELQAASRRLAELAERIDGDLGRLSSEPDPTVQQALLGPARERVEAIIAAASQVRTSLLQQSAALQEAETAQLTQALGEESSRLTAFTQAYRELRGGAL